MPAPGMQDQRMANEPSPRPVVGRLAEYCVGPYALGHTGNLQKIGYRGPTHYLIFFRFFLYLRSENVRISSSDSNGTLSRYSFSMAL